MKPWDELTERGRLRRLRAVALDALNHYRLDVSRVRLIGGFSNALFRVDTADGTYALRVDYLQDHSDRDAAVEAAWLADLADRPELGHERGRDLDVCRIVPAADGRLAVHGDGDGVPGERRCVLFEWIGGKELDEDLQPERYRQLGRAAATLHLLGADFSPPTRPMAWDRVFYWPEEVDPVVHDRPEHAHLFTGCRREIFDSTIALCERAFARLRLRADEAQIIHADLHPWNVFVKGPLMTLLDFEDVAWGHRVQDVAITFYYKQDHADYPALIAAFEEGYRPVAPWPEAYPGEIDHFVAARTAMFVNFMLNVDPAGASEFYDSVFPRLAAFVDRWG